MMRTITGTARRYRVVRAAYGVWRRRLFPGSSAYWETKYAAGGNSGPGSYGALSLFKSEVVNEFIRRNGVRSVIEFGCGDGNQLTLFDAPRYTGLDVSKTSLRACIDKFRGDSGKSFLLYDPLAYWDGAGVLQADLALSLDVIFHLVEDEIYEQYLRHLFRSARKHVIIYSSDSMQPSDTPQVRHRPVTSWVEDHLRDWTLIQHIPNRYPYDPQYPMDTSFADFYIYGLSGADREMR